MACASLPREGSALLQGRAVCGRCGRHLRVRYAERRGGLESWYVCDRATNDHADPSCQSIAGPPIDAAIGQLVAAAVTPAAVELAMEVRREIETRYDEADQLRRRAVERAQIDADLAKRRFMNVDPSNRLVADTLEADWNTKLRGQATARKAWEREQRGDQRVLDDATRDRLVAMATDFKRLWEDSSTSNPERKRMLAHVIEDTTLIKSTTDSITTIHVRFKGGKTETLTTRNPKTSAQQVKTPPETVRLVDQLLDDHPITEIADLLNARGLQPGGSERPGRSEARFDGMRVAYLARSYGLRSRYDRLRTRGMLTKIEMSERLGIHPQTLVSWAMSGIVTRQAFDANEYLYEEPGPSPPTKHHSRWDRLADRAAARTAPKP